MNAEPEPSTFAAVFARHPVVPRRGLLPGPRVWLTLGAVAVLAAAVLSPFLLGGGRSAPFAVDARPGAVTGKPNAVAGSGAVIGSGWVTRSGSPPTSPESAQGGPPDAEQTTPSAPGQTPAATPTPPGSVAMPAAPTQPSPSGRAIVSVHSRLCLSATAGTVGTELVIDTCDNSPAQRWEALSDGTIRSVGLCMSAASGSTANGTRIALAHCNGLGPQHFRLNASNDVVNLEANKCADVTDWGTRSGTLVQLWTCRGQDNQKWFWR